MIVPRFWAEGRALHRSKGRHVTVRRFGWSNESESAAQTMADERATAALQQILSGHRLPRREPKIPYNGAAGVPIREQIVAVHGDTVITRNSYGARCLNSPDVFFADIDFCHDPPWPVTLVVFLLFLIPEIWVGWIIGQKILAACLLACSIMFSSSIARALTWLGRMLRGGPDVVVRKRIVRFVDKHREWNFRLYRTPAGIRLLATHKLFDPTEPAVSECFRALGADPLYVKMCLKQRCFRARLSAKPWRIGIGNHLKPRPGVWPITAERLPDREAWIAQYETVAHAYAACEFLESLGSGIVNSQIRNVIDLHDRHSQANSRLPIA